MPRESMTETLYVIQGSWGQGWEDECAALDYEEAKSYLRDYLINQPEAPHRIIRRKVWKDTGEPYDSGTRRVRQQISRG